MRNAEEARRMSSKAGQRQYADWLYAGLERYLRHPLTGGSWRVCRT